MEGRYTILSKLGEGAYGYVWKAIHHPTSEVVAIKQLKNKSSKSEIEMVEYEALYSLKGHPNIIELKDTIKQDNSISYIFEYMENNLFQVIRKQVQPLSEVRIKNWMHQILKAVEYMHKKGYIHRDMKPENILITGNALKVADFGMAKKMCSHCHLAQTWMHLQHDEGDCLCGNFSSYICTRWYRAPELLMHSQTYTSAIDMWSIGVIMAELFRCAPLFPGVNEHDQLKRICQLIGAPNHYTRLDATKLAKHLHFQFRQAPPISDLTSCTSSPSPEALNLIQALCTWDPKKRLTASEALQHPFFISYTNSSLFYRLSNPIDLKPMYPQHVQKQLQNAQLAKEPTCPYSMQESKGQFQATRAKVFESSKESNCKCIYCLSHIEQSSTSVLKQKVQNRQDIVGYTYYPNYISSYRQACNSVKIASTIG